MAVVTQVEFIQPDKRGPSLKDALGEGNKAERAVLSTTEQSVHHAKGARDHADVSAARTARRRRLRNGRIVERVVDGCGHCVGEGIRRRLHSGRRRSKVGRDAEK